MPRAFCVRSVREQRGGEVTVAGIREEDDDGLARVLRALGQLHGGMQGRTGGDADQHALFSADELAGGKGVFIGDGKDLVIDPGVEHIGDEARADALDLMCARNALGQDRGAFRLDGDDLDGRVACLEIAADAGDGAAGADAGDEVVDLAVGIL